jgi:hypothetical protein
MRAVPVLGVRRDAGHIAGRRVHRRFAAQLRPPLARQKVERLLAAVPMPVRARPAPKGHPADADPLARRYLADLDLAGEVLSTPLLGW